MAPTYDYHRNAHSRFWTILFLFLGSVVGFNQNVQSQEEFDWFEAKIRPILVERCYECHAGEKAKGGLSLDSKVGWMRGGDSGTVILPGDPDQSLLVKAIQYDELQMPPSGKLPDREIELLIDWVKRGAPDPRERTNKIGGMDITQAKSWWAFQPLPAPLPSFSSEWIDEQIDRTLAEQGIKPSAPADRATLIRRLCYDLHGLPPTYEEVSTQDRSIPEWIDTKLASQEYGIQWGRHWLDVVRYADTAGENTDRPVVNGWRYRNWVFDAFNSDLPFDRFTRLQIAGDTLANPNPSSFNRDGIIATGYLAIARRFGHDIDKDMYLTYEELIDNIGKSFLGLTLGCARCHDHKYDPVSAQDYYALYGILASSKYSFPGCEPKGQPKDMVPLLPTAEVEALMKPWQAIADSAREQKQKRDAELAGYQKVFTDLQPEQRKILFDSAVAEGESVSFDTMMPSPEKKSEGKPVHVEPGEVLLLTVFPNANHGADSTLVQWTIEELADSKRVWTTDDLIQDFSSSNFRESKARSQGTETASAPSASWCYLEPTKGFEFLTDLKTNNGGNPKIHSWSRGELPSVFANTSNEVVGVWTNLPPQSLFVHPNNQRPVSIAWVSPISCDLRIVGKVQDAHPAALDGVSFKLEHIASVATGTSLKQIADVVKRPIPDPGPAPVIPVAYAVIEGTPSDAKLHLRGDPEKPGEVIPRRWIEVLGGQQLSNPSASGRQELSNWIVEHPLFARVIVNRVWHWHFGQGLVATPNDFGSRGSPPSHPELLGQLASQFVASGYSVKQLHRWIINTRAYQRSSTASQEQLIADPENRYLSHFTRRRLSAEEIRDSILMVTGSLDRTIGEGHPFPSEATWTFSQHDPFNAIYDHKKRSAMLMVQRQRRHPFLALFDGADPNASTPVRQSTTVPTQALYYLNDSFFHEQAAVLSQSLLATSNDAERLRMVFEAILQRKPKGSEDVDLLEFIHRYPGGAVEGWSAAIRILMASNEFNYVE